MAPTDVAKPHYFQDILANVHLKLKEHPTELTTEDARRLSENVNISDRRAALIATAVESYVIANEAIHDVDPELGQAPRTSLSAILNDLKFAVMLNPHEVTQDHLKVAQEIVSKMHRVSKPATAVHPELEAELKEEIAKIEPKVAEGTVTVEEANHLHSLEARAHGHTEKGGITSLAQSVAAKRERQFSLSSGSGLPVSTRSRSNSTALSSQQLSHDDRETNPHKVEIAAKSNTQQGTVTKDDAKSLQLCGSSLEGPTSKGDLGAQAQAHSIVTQQRRKQTLSNSSNMAAYTVTEEEYKHRKEQSKHDKEMDLKVAEMTITPKLEFDAENITVGNAAYVHSCEHRTHGHAEKDGLASKAVSSAREQDIGKGPAGTMHRRENTQPMGEVD